MGKVTPELIRAQALDLRGVKLSGSRAEELAADIAKANDAVIAARGKLDFNDEPARFAARLAAAASSPRPGKRK